MNDGIIKVTDEEWENRRLCSDENCIGVIGADGRCKECGKPLISDVESEHSDPDVEPDETVPGSPESQTSPEDDDEVPQNDPAETEDDAEWGNRRLCSDGNCIGVIGPDGRCKECGKPFDGNTAED